MTFRDAIVLCRNGQYKMTKKSWDDPDHYLLYNKVGDDDKFSFLMEHSADGEREFKIDLKAVISLDWEIIKVRG